MVVEVVSPTLGLRPKPSGQAVGCFFSWLPWWHTQTFCVRGRGKRVTLRSLAVNPPRRSRVSFLNGNCYQATDLVPVRNGFLLQLRGSREEGTSVDPGLGWREAVGEQTEVRTNGKNLTLSVCFSFFLVRRCFLPGYAESHPLRDRSRVQTQRRSRKTPSLYVTGGVLAIGTCWAPPVVAGRAGPRSPFWVGRSQKKATHCYYLLLLCSGRLRTTRERVYWAGLRGPFRPGPDGGRPSRARQRCGTAASAAETRMP